MRVACCKIDFKVFLPQKKEEKEGKVKKISKKCTQQSERISAEHQSRIEILIINFKIQRVSEAFKFMRQ